MPADLNHILVFKTNIQTAGEKMRIQPMLDTHDKIQCWNIDQQDVDCVLRVVSDCLTEAQIISMITAHGFDCAGLE